MKIRTDFVTNSSSSSFVVEIKFDLKNGSTIDFNGNGATAEEGMVDYFDGEVLVTISPKELGTSESVEQLIKRLQYGVKTSGIFDDKTTPVFVKPRATENEEDLEAPDATEFIDEIRENITSMNDIAKITLTGREENYVSYLRSYTYDLQTGEYLGMQYGNEFEKDGGSGGDFRLSDLNSCKIKYTDDEEEFDEFTGNI